MNPTLVTAIFTSGSTLYVVLVNSITGKFWNTNTNAWETFNSANWAYYAVALTEATGSGIYTGARPSGVAGSLLTEVLYKQVGDTPAISDAPPQNLLQSIGVNIAAVAGDAVLAPANMQAANGIMEIGTVQAGTISNTSFPTNLAANENNAYVGRRVIFTSGANKYQVAAIQAYNGSSQVLTVTPLNAAPSAADTFIVV